MHESVGDQLAGYEAGLRVVRHSRSGGIGGSRTRCDYNVPLEQAASQGNCGWGMGGWGVGGWAMECDQGEIRTPPFAGAPGM
jgi:hypothetical protein